MKTDLPSALPYAGPAARRTAWTAVLVFFVVSVLLIALPAVIIHPFKAQTPRGVTAAFVAHRLAQFVVPIGALVALALTVALWRSTRSLSKRVALTAMCTLLVAAAWFVRQFPFEWMFNPIQRIAFAPASAATWCNASDEVMAVNLHGDAVAYPVRQMAYHHIVHDTIGGVPVVATY